MSEKVNSILERSIKVHKIQNSPDLCLTPISDLRGVKNMGVCLLVYEFIACLVPTGKLISHRGGERGDLGDI